MIKILSFINDSTNCDLTDIHDHAKEANRPGVHVRFIDFNGKSASVVWTGPSPADVTDLELIKADADLSDVFELDLS